MPPPPLDKLLTTLPPTCQPTFLIVTPLQLLIALAIIRQLKSPLLPEIKIIDGFSNAQPTAARLTECLRDTCTISFYHRYEAAIESAVADCRSALYLHWDLGFRTHFILRKIWTADPRARISVFEEGVGTYRTDIYKGIRKLCIRLLGLPTRIGEHKKTAAVFVYNPYRYRATHSLQAHIVPITHTVVEVIDTFYNTLCYAFDDQSFLSRLSPLSRHSTVYLSGWRLDSRLIQYLRPLNGDLVIKPHPSLKTVQGDLPADITVCPNGIPAELLLRKLSDKYATVTVLHHGSSTQQYLQLPNIRYQLMPDSW